MAKLVSYMHTSLDMFVAGLNGEMDWIKVDEEIFDFGGQRTDKAKTALYGRNTFEMMEGYWPTAADQPGASKHDIQHARWYKSVKKIVMSKTLKGKNLPNTTIVSDNLKEEITKLKKEADTEIIIFGSPGAVHSLMGYDLIDEFWLYVNPVLLGKGIPLFKNMNEQKNLKFVSQKVFSNGVICLQYQLEKVKS